ncbi:MAG TPA: hypothetical protein VIJ46_05495 [Rhabdochlamydiaceae bacterium]
MTTFNAFVQASRGAQPRDRLIVSGEGVHTRDSNAPSSEAENKAVWRCFKQAIQSHPRNQEICKRYQFQIDRHIARGDPFLPEYAEMFGIGVADVHLMDLILEAGEALSSLFPWEITRRMDALRRLSPEAFAQKVEALNVARFIPVDPPRDRWHQFFIPDHFRKDQHRLRMLQQVPHLPQRDAFLELLCKKVVQHEMDKGTLVPAPSPRGGIEYYEIAKKVGSGAGLVAYLFKPVSAESTLRPLLIFRPTQFHLSSEDAVPTLLNDLERNIGHTGYLAAKPALDELMRNPDYQDIEAAGFSLGGVHLQRFLVDHYAKVTRATFFNDPSIDVHTAGEYAQRVNQLPLDRRISLVFYRTIGDRCHYFGHHHVGKGVTNPNVDMRLVEVYYDRRNVTSARALHSEPMLHDPGSHVAVSYRGEELQAHLDTTLRGVEVAWYETLRQSIGGQILFALLELIYNVVKAILDLFGLELFRSSLSLEDRSLVRV